MQGKKIYKNAEIAWVSHFTAPTIQICTERSVIVCATIYHAVQHDVNKIVKTFTVNQMM